MSEPRTIFVQFTLKVPAEDRREPQQFAEAIYAAVEIADTAGLDELGPMVEFVTTVGEEK